MEKITLAAASFEKQKYFFEAKFDKLPEEIQTEIKMTCVMTAQKLCCTFVIGFEETGDIFFEIVKEEGQLDFDDIGAELEIKEISRTKKELLKALKLWFLVFQTKEGEEVAKDLLNRAGLEETLCKK